MTECSTQELWQGRVGFLEITGLNGMMIATKESVTKKIHPEYNKFTPPHPIPCISLFQNNNIHYILKSTNTSLVMLLAPLEAPLVQTGVSDVTGPIKKSSIIAKCIQVQVTVVTVMIVLGQKNVFFLLARG